MKYLLLVLLVFCGIVDAGDKRPAPINQIPKEFPNPLQPKLQKDSFSCGFLAMEALYESYELDIVKANLRGRLGTDKPAIPFLADSKGTLQPDLFRVLAQDGFEYFPINAKKIKNLDPIIDHLKTEHYALALVKSEKTGGLHWVVFTEIVEGEVVIADSLGAQIYNRKVGNYFDERVLSVVLVKLNETVINKKNNENHKRGLVEMLKTWLRS